jgi:hypothetical protein
MVFEEMPQRHEEFRSVSDATASAGFNLVGLNCVDTDFLGQWRIEAEDHRTHYGPGVATTSK